MSEYKRIMNQIKDLQAQADQAWKEQRPEMVVKARALVEEFQIKPAELFKKLPKPVKAKYSDGVHNWSGRGLTPVWLREKIQAGAVKEDFLIK